MANWVRRVISCEIKRTGTFWNHYRLFARKGGGFGLSVTLSLSSNPDEILLSVSM